MKDNLPAEVAKTDAIPAIAQSEVGATLAVLHKAVESGVDADSLSKILDMQERILDRAAAQEFADALAEFQNDCPLMQRTSTASIATKSGAKYSYKFAALDEIAKTIQPVLHRHGFSYSWDCEVEGAIMTVTCTLRHRNGHRESAKFVCPTESSSPGMSPQQKNAGALTFAKRQSLTAVLGLTMTDPDTDGASDPTAKVNADQVVKLEDALEGLEMDRARFFKAMGVDSDKLSDIPANVFPSAMSLIRQKRAAVKEGGK